MKTYTDTELRDNLHHVLEQARVRGVVRIRRADGQEFILRPALGAGIIEHDADEGAAWADAVARVAVLRDDLRCVACGYNLRELPVANRCPECGMEIAQTIEAVSAADPELRSNLRRAQAEVIARSTDYPPDAFLFITDALIAWCRRHHGSLPNGPVPLSAAMACTAIRDYAARYFNDHAEARDLLDEWRIRSSEDVGAIIRTLVEAGALAVTGCDQPAGFRGIFTVENLFDQ